MNITESSNKLSESSQSPVEKSSFRSMVINSSIWVMAGYGVSQVIRLGANLVLTRLLFPEAFGLMALITIFLMGINAISDIGLQANIIHNPRADEESFLNTAWTIKIIRGIVMFLLVSLCAWPAAKFYDAPQLIYLLPATAIVTIIDGFSSTSISTLVRQISLRAKVLRDIGCQVAGLAMMVLCAYVLRSVWALVIGSVFRQLLLMIWSHFLIPGYKNSFAFDPKAAKAIYHFGKWVFLSTLLTFVVSQGDRIALGKLFTSDELGVYSIAFFLASAAVLACQQLASNVLFPTYTQLARRGDSELRKKTLKIKGVLYLISLPPLCIISIFGQQIVGLLYDARYKEAGWMLQILAVRSIARIIIVTTEHILLANGDTFRHMLLQLIRVLLMGGGMYIGYVLNNTTGLLIGMSVSAFVEYIFISALIRKYGAWLPLLDIPSMVLSVALIYAGIYLI